MAEKLLTDRKCQSAKAVDREILHADGGNLYLRVRPTGKDWLLIYRFEGRQRKLGLGSYPDITLSQAREKASEGRKLLAQNIDPHEQRKHEEIARKAERAIRDSTPQTVSDLFEEWVRRDLRNRREDAGSEVERSFKKDVLPAIGDLPLSVIRRIHITEVLDKMRDRGVTRMAGIVLADLRQMFGFGVMREWMLADPTFGLKKTAWNGISGERDRVLSEPELIQLAHVLPKSDLIEESQRAIWIMLATLARVGELSRARWDLIDFDKATWVIPKEHAKNGIEHTINLSPFALGHFKARHEKAMKQAEADGQEASAYVFPARHHDGHVCVKSLAKQIADRQRTAGAPLSRRSPLVDSFILPGGKWTPHDLRRTGATLMGTIGVRPDVIEKCLNHVEQNRMMRVYQRQELRPEMQKAWNLLGTSLERIIG